MAFKYGKETLDIKNPFKVEGKLDLIYGTLTFLLGIILIFQIRTSASSGFKVLAWVELVLSVLFLTVGLRAIILGSIKLFRFLVGREIPLNLFTKVKDQKITAKIKKKIKEVLMKRVNPTFEEKDGFLSRLLISIYERFIFLPKGFRILLESVSSLFFSFVIFLIVYLLSVFSISLGLISVTEKDEIITIYGVIFLVKQIIVWFFYRPNKKRISSSDASVYSYGKIIVNVILAILAPISLEMYVRNGGILPNLDINTFLPIALLFLLSGALVAITVFLCIKRLDVLNPETSVSEYKEHIQVAVHPKDIFRCFEIEMANKRYKEMPNRKYVDEKPFLFLEGSENKGAFKGDTVQETQPIYVPGQVSGISKTVRFYLAIIGRALVFLSFLYLFFMVKEFYLDTSFSTVFNTFYYPILVSFFGYYLIRIAHIFYSEILFSSTLVHFFSDGTYTESKVSSGMSVYDSNRSENTVVNTSATPWILTSKIITSTLADSSTKNLEGERHILEMYKNDEFLDDLVSGFTNYLKDRKHIVGFSTQGDIEKSMDFHKLNEMTRGTMNTDNKIAEQSRDKLEE
ncbi:hypothetical protein SAMN04488007_2256 [Maribacter aquivivus]|uniref:Uncharacterized protein n=1 Tax=Maribacter aquivivus TaxID=228958 RepID=A0A1M6QB40_9FLAO|nr:hypothetical protein [Maribacter aquivivus]SHK17350.1 hypothetical protein SAMN04488007_2256 [Maribacter aquivivus]